MDISEVKIKNLEREDLKNLWTFFDEINSYEPQVKRMPEHMIESILTHDEMRENTFLMYLEDKIIGFACCMMDRLQTKNANGKVVIHPNYRQQGLGNKLFDIILDSLKKNDIKNLTTVAMKSMPEALNFAQNRGFEIDHCMWEMDLELSEVDYIKIPVEKCDIRVATIEDNKDYVDIMNSGFKEEGDELYTDKSFVRMFGIPNKYVFFIEQDNKIVSTAVVHLQEDLNSGYITNLTVYKEFRGKGFGEITLSHCINIIKEAGLEKAALGVVDTNINAFNLYKKLGFVKKDIDIILKLKL